MECKNKNKTSYFSFNIQSVGFFFFATKQWIKQIKMCAKTNRRVKLIIYLFHILTTQQGHIIFPIFLMLI